MNRRNFLRSIATACGAAVVCPGELLKPPIKHLWMRGKDGSYIVGIDRAIKGTSRTVIFVKARQQGCTDSTRNWVYYYTTYNYDPSNLEKLRAAFLVHPFEPPLITGAHDEKIQTTHRPNQICSQACDPSD